MAEATQIPWVSRARRTPLSIFLIEKEQFQRRVRISGAPLL